MKLNFRLGRQFFPITLFILLAVMALAACGGGGQEDNPSTAVSSTGDSSGADANGVSVIQAVMGTDIAPQQQITGYATRVFPEGTSRVYAVLVMEGVKPGAEVTGRWYQLSVDQVEPDGHFVNEGGVTLTDANINSSGQARVALNFGSKSGALPNGDWLVRVYVDGKFVRTMAFVISSFVTLPEASTAATPTAGPEPSPATEAEASPPPAEERPSPTQIPATAETYTVVSGDTLTTIAEQFKGPGESTDAYVARLLALNGLQPGAVIFVAQELKLPPPQ